MANAEKTAAVAEITESFRGASAALLTEYRGLSVSEISELRRALGDGAQYAVVKNTLTKIAAKEAGVAGIDELLAGPTAIAFVSGDPVEAAKGLRDFARLHPMLVVKGGVLDGKPLSAAEIAQLADLESREVLLASLAGALQASLSQAVGLFAAPLAQAARVLGALEAQRQAQGETGGEEQTEPPAQADPSAPAAAETHAAAETPAAAEVVADAVAPQPDDVPATTTDSTEATPSEPVEAAQAPQPDPSADAPAE